jgi:ribonuclease G
MEIYYGHPTQENIVGNIYKGKVEDVLPGLGSAFVDVGEKKSLFLSKQEISDRIMIEKGYKPWHGAAPINKLLRPGQTLTLQVRRGGIGSKNPQGTTKISLPGRFWVLLPTEDRLGVSRRIDSVRTQRKLRRVARQLKKEGQGMIARTAAQTATLEELTRDYELLIRTWESIELAAKTSSAPQLLYKGMGLVQTILRDRLLSDVTEVIVDSEFFYEKILYFLEYMHMEQYKDCISLYEGKNQMFEHYQLEDQIQATQSRRVGLEGGGSIVIDETEALIAIDVNTGGDVQHRDQRSAILNTNLQAAAEIARQLRLRQMSGIIIVDFVDMEDGKDEQRLIDKVKEELKKDRISADFVDLTGLGLVEITRKRAGESLADMLEGAQFDA